MATVVNARDVLLLATTPRLLWTGVRGVSVTSDYASFMVTEGTPSVPTITFTATLNGVNGTVNWSVLTGTATITPPATGLTATLDFANMASDVITVKAEVVDGGITYSNTISITKLTNGLAPKFLTITAPSQMFTRPDDLSSFTPAGITLTATPFGGTVSDPYVWKYWTGSAWSAAIGGATTNTLALTSGSFSGETRTYQATAIIGGTTVTDEYTVVRLTGGTDGFAGFLTNESVTVATDSVGTTPAFFSTYTAGTFKVYLGATDVTSSCTFSKSDTGCTTSITNGTGAYSASAMSSTDTAFSSFTATHTPSGLTITKVFTVTKAKSGVTGTTGNSTYTAVVYYRGTNPSPTANSSSGSYNFATGVLTAPTGNVTWLTSQPATTTDPTWATTFTFTGTTASGTITAGAWSAPRIEAQNGTNGAAGAAGEYRDVIQLYGTGTTLPSSVNYNFNSNSINTVVGGSGWSMTRPAASTSPTYMTTCLAKTTTPLVDVALTAWAAAVVVQQNGTNGVRTAILDMYQVAATAPTSFPSGTSTYTWASGQFTAPATLNGWSLTPPAAVVGQTLWIARTIFSDSLTTATSSVTWSAATAISLGASGVNGTRTAFMEVYQWAASAPTLFPVGNSTYTWSSGAFTAPATLNSWTLTPSAPVAGQTLWACSVKYADSLTTTTTSITWNATSAYAIGGAGSNGVGTRASVVSLYVWGWNTPSLPNGTTTYTWSTGAWSHASETNGWSSTIPLDGGAGKTLYYIEKSVVDATGVAATSTVTWASGATITNLSKNGVGKFTCYSKFNGNGAVPTGTVDVAVGSYPTSTAFGVTWLAGFTLAPPALTTGQTLWVCDGYTNTTGTVTWLAPYLSSFKVGSLSAFTADLGSITAGNIDIGSGATSFHFDNSGNLWLGATAFASAPFKVTNTGVMTASGATITGTLQAGATPPTISGTTISAGAGALFNAGGTFAIGDATNNITYNGTAITLNGNFVKNTNINVTDLSTINANMGAITAGSLSIGSGSAIFKVDSSGNHWSGNASYASAPFRVSNTGALVATGATISGAITATSGSFSGDLTSGTAAPTGTYPSNTMTGYGFKSVASTGAFVLGNATTNFAFDGTNNIVVNGSIVKAGNISVTDLSTIKNDMGAIVAGSLTVNTTGFVRGGQTAYGTGSGFWLGYDSTTYKFSIGNATKSLKWDGTDLIMTGDVLTSGKVISTNGTGTVLVNGVTYTSSIIGVASTNNGVTGKTTSGWGVLGESASSTGVRAMSGTGTAIEAFCYSESAQPIVSVLVSGTTARRGIDISVGNAGQTGIRSTIPTGGSGFSAELTGGIKLNAGSPLTTGGGTGDSGSVLISKGSSSSPAWGFKINGGSGTADGSGNLTITFVNPFTTTTYGITGAGTSGQYVIIVSKSTTGCVIQAQDRATGAAVPSAGISWTAIGT